MPLDSFVTLGRSGLKVSRLCLGTMTFGQAWDMGSDQAECARVMDGYFAHGGNFLDTADMYTEGHAETIIGAHLAATGRRDRTVIATKFSGNLRFGDPNAGGASRSAIASACEQSLRRLRTDYIDLYWMHWWDPFTPIEETMRALDDLVTSGKVRYIGFSDTPAWRCAQAQMMSHFRGWAPLIALQMEYSLVERTIEGEVVPMAAELGTGIMPWSPLAAGALTGKYTRERASPESAGRTVSLSARLSPRTFDIVDVLREIAAALDSSAAKVALAWVLAQPGIASAIIGARTIAQLDDNIGCTALTLDHEQLRRLDAVSRPQLGFPAKLGMALSSSSYGGMTIDGVAIAPNYRSIGPDTKIW